MTRFIAKPWRSVAFKLSLLTCLFVLAVIALMARAILQGAEDGFIGQMRVRSEFFARRAREAMLPKVDDFSLHFAVEEALREQAVTQAAILDADGRALSHSKPELIGEVLSDPVSLRARQSPQALLQSYRDASGLRAYSLSAPILVGQRRVGTALIGFSRSSLDQALAGPKRQILAIAAGATAAAVLGTILIVGWIMRPLPRLAAAAEEVGRGNFAVRVDWRSQDEIGLLSRAFNDMAIANSLLFATLREEKEKLETIFHETREGMVWADTAGKVLLLNPSARALLGCQQRAVDRLETAAAAFKAAPALPDILAGRSRITPFELTRAEPKLLILSGIADRLGTPEDPGGFLFIFHDATLEKRGEVLSRNFLSLVSHKLRTPLTIALGFLEMVQADGGNLNAFQQNALKKIREEDEKLRSLVEKLITFSTVHSPENIVLDRVKASLREPAEAAIKNLGLASRPGVRLIWKPEELAALPPVSMDPFLVREAIANLLENAVKFNRGEDKEVVLSASREDGVVRVRVRDNGPGIPGEEHPHLFRRFYQVDEHFTGQIPGFGLGLAFVKNVAQAHGGQVGLRSEPGRGSEFFFTLPVEKPI